MHRIISLMRIYTGGREQYRISNNAVRSSHIHNDVVDFIFFNFIIFTFSIFLSFRLFCDVSFEHGDMIVVLFVV